MSSSMISLITLTDMLIVTLQLVPSLLFIVMSIPIYPETILNGRYVITGVRDLTTGYDNTKPGDKAVLPTSKSSQMITFTFKNGLVATLRTSGTEPKIKYYTELCAPPEEKDLSVLNKTLNEMVLGIVSEFLQPQENNLIARSS